jgi:hypothetical protein
VDTARTGAAEECVNISVYWLIVNAWLSVYAQSIPGNALPISSRPVGVGLGFRNNLRRRRRVKPLLGGVSAS